MLRQQQLTTPLHTQSPTNLSRISENHETKLTDEEEDDPYCVNDDDDDDMNDIEIIIEDEEIKESPKDTKTKLFSKLPSIASLTRPSNSNSNSNPDTNNKHNAVHKNETMVEYFPSIHGPTIQKQKSRMRRYSTVRTQATDLSEQECELLENQIDILLDTDIQKLVLSELLKLYPKLRYAFSMVSGEEAQAAFVCKMVRKGYVHVYNHNYDQIYNIFCRHPKYNIKKEYISSSFGIILKSVLKHKSITESLDSTLLNRSKIVWTKSNQIMEELMSKAYKFDYNNKLKKKPDAKKLKKNRNRIARSMSEEDIACVQSIWKRMIEDNKEKVGDLLAVKLQKQTEIFQAFQVFYDYIF